MQPNPPSTSRLPFSIVIAACIVAVGLVSAARIVAGRPVPSSISMQQTPATVLATSPQSLVVPPFSQEAVQEQVRRQLLAAPELPIDRFNKVVYRLSDATVSDVSYSAKDDTFFFRVNWTSLPATPSSSLKGTKGTYATLNNNGYNQYIGDVAMDMGYVGTLQSVSVRVK